MSAKDDIETRHVPDVPSHDISDIVRLIPSIHKHGAAATAKQKRLALDGQG
jgi:hypothetical protein